MQRQFIAELRLLRDVFVWNIRIEQQSVVVALGELCDEFHPIRSVSPKTGEPVRHNCIADAL
jgi:hypothetical protein